MAIPKAIIHKSIDYYSEMPRVLRKSRINLNVTLRSITSGIPLRVYDILGAGGFCLTNYQEVIVQLFKAGEELVVFTNKDDMFNKVEYFFNDAKHLFNCSDSSFVIIHTDNFISFLLLLHYISITYPLIIQYIF